ncbi:hypothetical protein CBL_20253 [Carabus blaptoides fortunei]
MEKLKFEFKMKGSADGKSNSLCITSIETLDGRRFIIPDELQPATLHNTINKKMTEKYLDEEENLQFDDYFLEQVTTNKTEEAASAQNTSLEKLLETLIENNRRVEEMPLDKIAKEITIHKFNNKTQNASQWLSEFEEECERYNYIRE